MADTGAKRGPKPAKRILVVVRHRAVHRVVDDLRWLLERSDISEETKDFLSALYVELLQE